MARLIYSSRAFSDLDRLTDFLSDTNPVAASETVELITEAVSILKRHPLIGRPVEDAIRELVISRGKTGYIALYSYEAEHDAILILAIRHQRESGFQHQGSCAWSESDCFAGVSIKRAKLGAGATARQDEIRRSSAMQENLAEQEVPERRHSGWQGSGRETTRQCCVVWSARSAPHEEPIRSGR